MGEEFYAVQQTINGRAGTLPTIFGTLAEAKEFVDALRKHSGGSTHEFKIMYHIYKAKKIITVVN